MDAMDTALHELATTHGVATWYRDGQRRRIDVDPDVVRRVLGLLGVGADTPAQVRDALAAARRPNAGRTGTFVVFLAFANAEGDLPELREEIRQLQELFEGFAREGRCELVFRPNATLEQKLASEDELKKIDADVRDIVNEASEFATNDPEPDPAELWTDVYR